MGFISKLFSKKNKDLQKTSNDSPRESDVLSVSDKDALDYSNLSFDCNGWLTYPDGLRIRNVSSVLESFNDEEKVFEIMDETKKILGYNSGNYSILSMIKKVLDGLVENSPHSPSWDFGSCSLINYYAL